LTSQVVGWLLITTALPRLPAIETSILLLVQPVFTLIWGLVLFSERLSPAQWAGAGLVLGGIALASASRAAQESGPSIARGELVEPRASAHPSTGSG
jgi:drug/metabolite transporter (DMT)-like permease